MKEASKILFSRKVSCFILVAAVLWCFEDLVYAQEQRWVPRGTSGLRVSEEPQRTYADNKERSVGVKKVKMVKGKESRKDARIAHANLAGQLAAVRKQIKISSEKLEKSLNEKVKKEVEARKDEDKLLSDRITDVEKFVATQKKEQARQESSWRDLASEYEYWFYGVFIAFGLLSFAYAWMQWRVIKAEKWQVDFEDEMKGLVAKQQVDFWGKVVHFVKDEVSKVSVDGPSGSRTSGGRPKLLRAADLEPQPLYAEDEVTLERPFKNKVIGTNFILVDPDEGRDLSADVEEQKYVEGDYVDIPPKNG